MVTTAFDTLVSAPTPVTLHALHQVKWILLTGQITQSGNRMLDVPVTKNGLAITARSMKVHMISKWMLCTI